MHGYALGRKVPLTIIYFNVRSVARTVTDVLNTEFEIVESGIGTGFEQCVYDCVDVVSVQDGVYSCFLHKVSMGFLRRVVWMSMMV